MPAIQRVPMVDVPKKNVNRTPIAGGRRGQHIVHSGMPAVSFGANFSVEPSLHKISSSSMVRKYTPEPCWLGPEMQVI